jgi:hypothetical protein
MIRPKGANSYHINAFLFGLAFQSYVHFDSNMNLSGLSQVGGLVGAQAPQFLSEQLTISQPGGKNMFTIVYCVQAPIGHQCVMCYELCDFSGTWTKKVGSWVLTSAKSVEYHLFSLFIPFFNFL